MSGFSEALAFVLGREGGYSNLEADRGGATNFGVTRGAYDAYRKRHGLLPRSVREITDEEVAGVYREDYWEKASCDSWWWPLSLAVFDAAVQHGPSRAIKLLQRVTGARVDGIAGPQTRGAVATTARAELLRRLRWERMRYYGRIVANDTTQAVFLVGWINRMRDLDREVAA